jgi:hypothetical protein
MQRAVVAGAFTLLVGLLGFVAASALGAPWWGALLATLAPAALAGRALVRVLPAVLFQRRLAFAAWALFAALGLAQTTRASVFMLDASHSSCSVAPWNDFLSHHSCYSSYYEGARLARSAPNLYDPDLYQGSDGRQIGPFNVDLYEYPPPFLVPFRLAVLAHLDFFALRGLWFALELGLVAGALLLLAWHIGGRDGLTAGLLAPLVLFCVPTQITLQLGNFQLLAIALTVIAMIAFEHERPVVGGALLAYVTLSKLFPGVFLLVLLLQRRWRALACTGVALGVWVGLAVALLGVAPFHSFVDFQMPRIASGAAFPFLQFYPPAAAVNHSFYGIVIKLQHLGLPVGPRLATVVSWVYTPVVLGAAWLVARRNTTASSRLSQAQGWLILAILAALRSPFVPQEYALFGPIWLLSLLAVRQRVPVTIALWLLLDAWFPVDLPVRLGTLMALTAIPQLVSFGMVGVALLRGQRTVPATTLRMSEAAATA